MINIGTAFVFSVLTFYSMYQYILQQNELFGHIAYVHINYQIFYMTCTTLVIYAGSLIAREVINKYTFTVFEYRFDYIDRVAKPVDWCISS